MATIDKRSNGRWRVRTRNRRAPALSKTLTCKADAMKWERDTEILKIKKICIPTTHYIFINRLVCLKAFFIRYRI